jgi:hypothetical protein
MVRRRATMHRSGVISCLRSLRILGLRLSRDRPPRGQSLSTGDRELSPRERERPSGATVQFRAYTSHEIIRGTYSFVGDRLTDALNNDLDLHLTDVESLTLADQHVSWRSELRLRRETILIVEGTGPRGNDRRRFRAFESAVAVKLGPYRVEGFIHSVRGAHPILGLYHRSQMVPMTDVRITYVVLGRPIVDSYPVVIINRQAIASIRLPGDDAIA